MKRPPTTRYGAIVAALIREDRQREFISLCRSLGIRTVAGFLIGFPDDTEESIRDVRDYAQQINPTYANFNVVTPYPGTAFFEQMRGQIADTDFSHYTVYTPLLKYEHLSVRRMEELLAKCFHRFYFRWQYLRDNAPLLWPALRRLGLGRRPAVSQANEAGHGSVPRPLSSGRGPLGPGLAIRRSARAGGKSRIIGLTESSLDRHIVVLGRQLYCRLCCVLLRCHSAGGSTTAAPTLGRRPLVPPAARIFAQGYSVT